jgi:phosphoserine phosphatase SerB
LCRILSRLGYKLAVVSGGFLPLAEHVKSHLGLDYAFANNLEITNNVLTGRINGSIVNAAKKADILKMIAQQNNIAREEIIAVGDGANDLLMMQAASLGIAFNAKPKVQELADARINQPSLLNVLHLLGMNEQTIEFLQQGLL